MKRVYIALISTLLFGSISAQQLDKIKFGDFNSWVTRHIHESKLLGGATKTIYEIGPNITIDGNKAYRPMNGSPWGTSNVYAKVSGGIVKGSNAIYPCVRSGNDRCAKLCSQLESIKVLGMINMEVMVAGSMFLGEMIEPVSSTKNPYSKMDMGMPYTKRPKALVFDYKVDMPNVNTRTKSTGFSAKKTLQGRDSGVVFVFLQRRWEDADGNLHANRVATGGVQFKNASNWKNGYRLPLYYGDCSAKPGFGWLKLRDRSTCYHARNSHGKVVPVVEEGWETDPNATPTHVIVMFSAGNGEPYVGTEGLTMYIDNVAFEL